MNKSESGTTRLYPLYVHPQVENGKPFRFAAFPYFQPLYQPGKLHVLPHLLFKLVEDYKNAAEYRYWILLLLLCRDMALRIVIVNLSSKPA
ncbi:hypothetical protein ABD76_27235 [Paenibacillus dendritiformis]|nr:hypothetical protein [Paenibacillus dendritiformis]